MFERDPDILKTGAQTMKFLGQGFHKLEHEQDRHNRQTDATGRILPRRIDEWYKYKSDL